MPTLALFLNLVIGAALLLLALHGLRRLWAGTVSTGVLAWVVAPGVILHELSHAAGCVLTGAKVHSITLWRSDGSGEVRHGPPRVRWLGGVVISLAPLVGGILALLLLGLLLRAPVNMYGVRVSGAQPDQFVFLADLARLLWHDFALVLRPSAWADWRSWLFLYFAVCITLTMGPSAKDLRNCAAGLLALCGIILLVHLVVDRLLGAGTGGPVFGFLYGVLLKLHYPLALAGLSALPGLLLWLLALALRRRRRER
jgi:hypothetical protein